MTNKLKNFKLNKNDIEFLFQPEKSDNQTKKILEFVNACINNDEIIFFDSTNETDDIKNKIQALKEVETKLKKEFEKRPQQRIDITEEILQNIQHPPEN